MSRLPAPLALAAVALLGLSGCGMLGGDEETSDSGAQAPEFNVNSEAYTDSSGDTIFFATPDKSVTCAVKPISPGSELLCNVPYAKPPFFSSNTPARSVENKGHGAGFVASTEEASNAANNARPLLAGNVISAYDFTCATPEDSVMECWHGDEHFRFAQGALESNDWSEAEPRKDSLPDGGLCGWTDVAGDKLPIVVRANGLGTMDCGNAQEIARQVVDAGFDSDSKLDSDYFGDLSCTSSDPSSSSSSSAIVDCSYSGGNTDSNVGFTVYRVNPR